ncbi:carboxypeptidase-like regulatory domain-containing protein [Cesiribacter andamanensis]|uniref:carboxypeptidase-like regulatory domain-containing protein n=1 Tax=Cesiribacter andamanensis TaxID=649507 RepID=UPI00034782A5|nr:carboxypeptidase-like regulatory domain-containing protein [Cesiribacter andamanensis]
MLLLLLLLSTSAALAQERVSGHVYSQKAGTPLAGVLVQLKGGGRQQLQMLRAHTS